MESAMNSKRGNMGEVVWELMEPINILISYRPKKQFNMTYSKLGTSVYGIFHNSKKFQTYSILYHMRPFNKTSNFSEVPSVFYERIFFVGRIGILFVNQKIFESSTSSELRDSTSLYRVPGAAAWPGLAAAAGAKFKFKHQTQLSRDDRYLPRCYIEQTGD